MPPELSILLVEPDAHLRGLVRSMLVGLGLAQVSTAADLEGGLDLVRAKQPDAVVAPFEDSDDLSFVRRLRDLPDAGLSMVPIVLTAAAPTRSRVLAALRAGAHDVLSKPFSARALIDHVRVSVAASRPFVRMPSFFGPLPKQPELRRHLGLDAAPAARGGDGFVLL